MVERILIVDDSPVARKIMLSCIPKDKGYEIIFAGDGKEGVTKYAEELPDVTFMDITMPVMDGLTALEEIMKLNEKAIVVMCTADIQPKSIQRANGLGALVVLRKPPTRNSVEEALAQAEAKMSSESGRPL
jgi:two-component system, chemotaxis family, chemotaxis protein CheY